MSPVGLGRRRRARRRGRVARFLLDGRSSARAGRDLPFGTLAVNVSGAFLLGFLAGVSLTRRRAGARRRRHARLVHHVLDVDVRVAAPRRGGRGALRGRQRVISLAVGLGAIALGRLIGSQL